MRLYTPVWMLLTLSACPPVSPDVRIAPALPDTLDDLQVSVDPPIASASYAWRVDGVAVPDLATDTVPSARTAKGQLWAVTVSEAGTERGDTQVVIGNAPPTATVSLPASGTAGRPLVATIAGVDPDEDVVTYEITWTVDGERYSETSDTLPGDAAARGSTVQVEVVPTDGEQGGEAVSASTVMGNGVPSFAAAAIRPAVPVESDEVVCIGSGWADPDGDPEGARTAWSVNGIDVDASETLTGLDFDKGDEIVCTLTPWDGNIEGDAVVSDAVVVGNTAPTVDGITFAPEMPRVSETIVASAVDVADLDGDRVGLAWAWDRDGTDLGVASDRLGIDPRLAHATIRVVVVPSDGESDGGQAVASFTVANTPPEITRASITGLTEGELRHGSTPSVTGVEASDVDGDLLDYSYDWQVNGSSVASTASCGGCELEKGDDVLLTVTADDAHGGTDTWTWSATTQNSPPSSFSIEADSASGKLGGDVFCDVVADATDADGDTLTYSATWTVNGAAWTGSVESTDHTDDTLPSDEIRLDDSVRCTMEVTDGADTAIAVSASKTFGTCPAVPGFVGSATPVDLSENSGICFYLTQKRVSCDATCASLGGGNHAADASATLTSRCAGPRSGDPAYDFLTGDNEGGWASSALGSPGARTLGHGYAGGLAYGACNTGSTKIGVWPGESNTDSSRSLVCACF